MKKMRANNCLRECSVAIEPNFGAIAAEWLRQSANILPNVVPPSSILVDPPIDANSNNQNSAASATLQRRTSVASGRNLFSVGDQIVEIGYDYLPRVSLQTNNQLHHPSNGPSLAISALNVAQGKND